MIKKMMARLYPKPEDIRGANGGCVLNAASLHGCDGNTRHRVPSLQTNVSRIKTELGDSLMHSGSLESSSVPSIPLFIHPLRLNRLHAVDIREMHASNSPWKRLFSTQMDCSTQRINKRRARGESMGIPETDHYCGAESGCPQDRDPGPGLLAFSRSPDSDPLFYKRNSNPQIGGHA
jgi:hypothetical protein